MPATLCRRISLTMAPLLLVLVVLGSAGVILLSRLGESIGQILRENFDSVVAMERLQEAVERIDSSFQFALVGRDAAARQQFASNWQVYLENFKVEQQNITLPGEAELVERLNTLTRQYRARGDDFYTASERSAARERDYFGPRGLHAIFTDIKQVSGEILRLNQNNMEEASRRARQIATRATWGVVCGLLLAIVLATIAAWSTMHTILQPLRALTQAAQGISAGNLDQVIPQPSLEEFDELAQAFNTMARHLRDYRQSTSARLLRAQQTSQATIDSFPAAVVVVDLDGGVEMANPVARQWLGVLPRSKDHPQPAIWQPPDPLREPLQEALQTHRDYLPEGLEQIVMLGAAGRERAVLPRVVTIRDPYGNALGAAVVLQDVTRLRLLDQMKSNLVATASHELKTPLTSIRLALHLLLEESIGPLGPKQLELVLDARDNSERLLAMINNLLDLARLEQGWNQFNVGPVAPASLLEAAADAIRPRAEDKGVNVVVEAPPGLPAVAADAARLGSALQNLLDNALTYTDRGGTITLSADRADDAIVLLVADSGIGIPPEYIPRLFEKFFRVPGQSRDAGTGLGLAIVREIVTAHGGTVTCECPSTGGALFRLSLPLAAAAPATDLNGRCAEPAQPAAS